MNMFNINDALNVWDSVKDSVKAIAANTRKGGSSGSGPDYSFITPTLMGKPRHAFTAPFLPLTYHHSPQPSELSRTTT